MSFSADPLSQHDCTSTSRISPALSTARQGTCADPESRLPSHPNASCPKVEASVPQSAGECRSELEHPPLAVLVRDVEPSLCQEFLDVSVAEREAQVQPDGVPDDLRWEPVIGKGDGLHPSILSPADSHCQRFQDKACRRLSPDRGAGGTLPCEPGAPVPYPVRWSPLATQRVPQARRPGFPHRTESPA
jgi:hypothetical protein